METNRLRSIVPMFGGRTQYVETLQSVLKFIDSYHPTTNELLGWHRGSFANVSSEKSIMRRVRYLSNAGFLQKVDGHWKLGPAGQEYAPEYDIDVLLRIMCGRNVGFRSLLYALAVAPMTIEEISDQQLDTHPELGWSRGETDMAFQRANWLWSMGLIQKQDDKYELTSRGREFVEDAVEAWAEPISTSNGPAESMTAHAYETVAVTRAVDPEFRVTTLERYNQTCPISGIDHPALLDVAHILSWSDYPKHRADLGNVLALSKTHHAAFDRGLFTISRDYEIVVNPTFETDSDHLKQTLVNQNGAKLPLENPGVSESYLAKRNSTLEWV